MKKFILTCLLAGTSAVMYGQKDEQGYEDGNGY